MTQNGMKDTFSENLRKAMQEKNMNQSQLAIKAETTPQNISKYCKGSVLPDLGIVVQIANALNVSVDSLLGNDGFSQKKNRDRFLVSDLLEQLVLIADTLNFNISDCECGFREYNFGLDFEYLQLAIIDFWKKWGKYRKLLEDQDIEQSDYDALISTQLNKIDFHISKNELLNLRLSSLQASYEK